MNPAIRVENLSKSFRIGARQDGYRTLRESLAEAAAAPFRRLHGAARRAFNADYQGDAGDGRNGETLWALKDVSFDVQPGEVVGIIGRNGAGKSTLLKVLSRITEPTAGRIALHGRVGSLLEVGTGFHHELTGRENIYMNGAILGMTRREIDRKFDEIVDFSGVEKFLDTPIKRYSSGMQVRLAFAVAANLEPEILVVDEVLAVGDFDFQRRCLGKMKDVAKSGRTVLFVSHNLAALEALCDQAVELRHGMLVAAGKTADVVDAYRRRTLESQRQCQREYPQARYMRSVAMYDSRLRPSSVIPIAQDVHFAINLRHDIHTFIPVVQLFIDDIYGNRALTIQSPASRCLEVGGPDGTSIVCTIRELPLAPGEYTVTTRIVEGRDVVETHRECLAFTVVNAEVYDEGRGFVQGVCVARSTWAAYEPMRHSALPV
ncbi:MAG: polysaccharide/polyol phosphate ABC transporter ATP-binding protein [Planctomycetota bacterium]|nr:MAG: polysaccharide/polyol phosphate ABC transporter ATP-binding protein [Planctomycetota bacterium]